MSLETDQLSSAAPHGGPGVASSSTDAGVIATSAHHATLAEEIDELTAAVSDGARSVDHDLTRADLAKEIDLPLPALDAAGIDLGTEGHR